MTDRSFLAWPFFDDGHRALAADLDAWAGREVERLEHGKSVDDTCRALVQALGEGGWLRFVMPGEHGGVREELDVRSICLAREILARHSGLADFAFAMQGLGTGAISLFGSRAQQDAILPAVRRGEALAAFALSEKEAGSDVAALAATARQDGAEWVLEGEKTWIS